MPATEVADGRNIPRLTVTVPEAAEMLGVSVPTAWNWVWNRTLPSVKLGGRRLVARASIEKLLIDGEAQ